MQNDGTNKRQENDIKNDTNVVSDTYTVSVDEASVVPDEPHKSIEEEREQKPSTVEDVQKNKDSKNIDLHPVLDKNIDSRDLVDNFGDEEATEVSLHSEQLSTEQLQHVMMKDDYDEKSLQSQIPVQAITADETISNTSPKESSETASSIRNVLLQHSEVDKDVLDSLKNHPFIDEEYIPDPDEFFDGSDISVIENFAFEEPSEVQDIRKLYGIKEEPYFPSELTKEIGILQESPVHEASHQENASQVQATNINPSMEQIEELVNDSAKRPIDTVVEKEAPNTQDDLVLDESMIKEEITSNTNIENSEIENSGTNVSVENDGKKDDSKKEASKKTKFPNGLRMIGETNFWMKNSQK